MLALATAVGNYGFINENNVIYIITLTNPVYQHKNDSNELFYYVIIS